MKRFLILALAVLVIASANTTFAAVRVSLNILYNNPAQPSLGGTWTLVAKSNTGGSTGITGLVTRFNRMPPAGVVHPLIGHDVNGITQLGVASVDHDNNPFTAPQTQFTYGQEPYDGLILQVGLPRGPSKLLNDPVGDNANWANSSVIATGSITNLTNLPTFAFASAEEQINGAFANTTIAQIVVRTYSVPEPATWVIALCAAFVVPARFTRSWWT